MKIPVLVCETYEYEGYRFTPIITRASGEKARILTVYTDDLNSYLTDDFFNLYQQGAWSENMSAKEIRVALRGKVSTPYKIIAYIISLENLSAWMGSEGAYQFLKGVSKSDWKMVGNVVDSPNFLKSIAKRVYDKKLKITVSVPSDARLVRRGDIEEYIILGEYYCSVCRDHVERRDYKRSRNGKIKLILHKQMTCDTCGAIEYEQARPLVAEREPIF